MKLITSTSFLLALSLALLGQNQIPVISNISAEFDYTNNQLMINYDVSDAENDSLEISVLLSDDSGESYLADISTASGDLGAGILSGTGKQIVWTAPSILDIFIYRVKLVANDGAAVDIQEMLNQVDSSRMRSELNWFAQARFSNSPVGLAHLTAVKDSIEQVFMDLDLAPYRHEKAGGIYTLQNIVGRRAGLVDEPITYIVDAHFDGVPGSPAADDNGSGTVGLLECARILSQYQFAHSIRFIGFDQEETGLRGSTAYVTDGIPDFEDLRGVLNFEMIGYYDDTPNTQTFPFGFDFLFPGVYNAVVADSSRGNFLTNVANENSLALQATFDSCAALYVPELLVYSVASPGNGAQVPDLLRSDHAPFWLTGRSALMLTDGAEFRNTNYHTPNDTVGTINFDFMQQIVKATIATLAALAEPIHAGVAVSNLAFINGLSELQHRCDFQMSSEGDAFRFRMGRPDCLQQEMQLQLVDLSGRIVRRTSLSSAQNEVQVSTTGLSSGIYFWRIQSELGSFSEKVLVR